VIPVSYDDDIHPYSDLVAGRVDAVLLDHIIADRSLRRTPGFVVQPVPVATGHYVAVFAKSNTALRDSADDILRARMKDGSLEKTFREWGVWDSTQVARLIDEISKGQLVPARYGTDPIAVNLVWLVEHMTVKPKNPRSLGS